MFFLDNPNSNKETYILIRLSLDDGRFKRSTGEKVHPSLWNQSKGRVKPSRGNFDISRINQVLSSIEEKINKKITELKISNAPVTKEAILGLFKKEITVLGDKQNKELLLLEALNIMIKDKLTLQIIGKSTADSYEDKLGYNIKCYQEEKNKQILLKSVNSDFVKSFMAFLYKRGLRDNTINKIISQLKSVLYHSEEKELFNNRDIKKIVKNVQTRQTDDVALTEEEIQFLYDLELNGMEENVRDLFLIGIYSGQRYSDYSVFKKEDIVKGKFIIKVAEKTEERSYIPLVPRLKKLLDKYNWELPKIIRGDFNEEIKKVCEKAGINETIKKTHFSGQTKTYEVKPKFMFVGSHTARRTFITISLEKGMNPKIVQKITGIKKIETLMNYYKVDEKMIMEHSMNVWGNTE